MTDYFSRLANALVSGPTIRPLLTSPGGSPPFGVMPGIEEPTVPVEANSRVDLPDREFSQSACNKEALQKTTLAQSAPEPSTLQRPLREELGEGESPDQLSASPLVKMSAIDSVKGASTVIEDTQDDLSSSSPLLPGQFPHEPTPAELSRSQPKQIDGGIGNRVFSDANATSPRLESAQITALDGPPQDQSTDDYNNFADDKSAPLTAERGSITRPLSYGHVESAKNTPNDLTRNFPFEILAEDNLRKDTPVVHVTIGRIEVRAITPATQKRQPSAPAAPKLSLAEFLRQHNGRQR